MYVLFKTNSEITMFFPKQVAQMSSFIAPLADLAVGAASRTADVQRKVDLLDQAKTVAESAAQLMYATKEGGGNPKVKRFYYCLQEVRLKVWCYGLVVCHYLNLSLEQMPAVSQVHHRFTLPSPTLCI